MSSDLGSGSGVRQRRAQERDAMKDKGEDIRRKMKMEEDRQLRWQTVMAWLR